MTAKSLFVKLCLTVVVLIASTGVNAQVTIGSTREPSHLSLLDLDATEQQKGLHNARLTTAQRDVLVNPASEQDDKNLAVGLMIFNTDNDCLEFWNGAAWISLCASNTPNPCGGFGALDTDFCIGATVADLTRRAREAGGNGNVQWFLSNLGGTALEPNELLVDDTEYFADNCAGATSRIPVLVSVVDCLTQPAAGDLTAWTTAMYDFQSQMLRFVGTDNATSWQWQVSINGVNNWQPISGATSRTFTIPVNFVYDNGFMDRGVDGQDPQDVDHQTRQLFFRVVRTNRAGTTISAGFRMLFIRTNTSGYSDDANGVRGLSIPRAGGGTVNMALLNLGATNDNSLGDFYQWGRKPDGHQKIVWDKTGLNNVFGEGTSLTETCDFDKMTFDAGGNGQVTNPPFIGRFITGGGTIYDWSEGDTNDRWGVLLSTFVSRDDAPTSINDWAFPANNPCPDGWRVPNSFEFGDIHIADGVYRYIPWSPQRYSDVYPFTNDITGNTWDRRLLQNGAVGGIILTTASGEALFFPAVGCRYIGSGVLYREGDYGRYWSSTINGTESGFAWGLYFSRSNTQVHAGSMSGGRANGFSVRCVAE